VNQIGHSEKIIQNQQNTKDPNSQPNYTISMHVGRNEDNNKTLDYNVKIAFQITNTIENLLSKKAY
jgi:hypothetical protein